MTHKSRRKIITLAREEMIAFKAMLTKDARGNFPHGFDDYDWNAINHMPPTTGWQEMSLGQRHEILFRVLNATPCSGEVSDRQKLVIQFMEQEPDYESDIDWPF
jgi:hypothetical protein